MFIHGYDRNKEIQEAISAGETVHVDIPVSLEELKYFDERQKRFVLEDTSYEFGIGAHSGDLLWV